MPQPLNELVKRAELDSFVGVGGSCSEAQWMKELERDVKELRRANETLKLACAFL